MEKTKRIALIAHDHQKPLLAEWCRKNRDKLSLHTLYATGTTGSRLQAEVGLAVQKVKSGPLGGDAQISAKLVEGEIDFIIFFWDPMSPQPHDVDVKALLRLAVLYNVPVANNQATADFLISSPLMETAYDHETQAQINRLKRDS